MRDEDLEQLCDLHSKNNLKSMGWSEEQSKNICEACSQLEQKSLQTQK